MRAGIQHLRYVPVFSSFCITWKYHSLQSPLSLSPPSDFRFPSPPSDLALDVGLPSVRVPDKDPLPRYSSMFRMGLFLTVRDGTPDLRYI
jgi:hypothetical protein